MKPRKQRGKSNELADLTHEMQTTRKFLFPAKERGERLELVVQEVCSLPFTSSTSHLGNLDYRR